MDNLVAVNFKDNDPSLEYVLDELSKYGRPSLLKLRDGSWVCTVEMFVTGTGVTFEVKSSFSNKDNTHKQAAMECYGNVLGALAKLRA